ncbi:hypothetical protein BC827DRAFT_1216357 [Russula dissimulans]|nr:hypothetical protein BC827DRAFT_1216357 [Russula dissimulans]
MVCLIFMLMLQRPSLDAMAKLLAQQVRSSSTCTAPGINKSKCPHPLTVKPWPQEPSNNPSTLTFPYRLDCCSAVN